MRTRFRSTPETDAAIIDLYESGLSTKQVAARMGCSTGLIALAMKRAGREMRAKPQKRTLTAAEKRSVRKAWDGGASTQEIAHLLGVRNAVTAKTLLVDLGVEWEARRVKGLIRTESGYLARWVRDGEPYADMRNKTGYVPEHRYQMAVSLGRSLGRSEQVHHINGDRSDNRIANLQLRTTHHGPGVVHHCLDCGSTNISSRHL